MKCTHFGFAEWYRRSVEGVSKVQHRRVRGSKGVVCRIEVSPGQPAGQVCLKPMDLVLLLLEEQLGSNQTFISPHILPTARREEKVEGQNSLRLSARWSETVMWCNKYIFFTFSIRRNLKAEKKEGNMFEVQEDMSNEMCFHTLQTKDTIY